MDRVELGMRLNQWHSSMHDPIYAVGSFYVDNKVYPDESVVDAALSNLQRDLDQFQRMAKGEAVMVTRQGSQVNLKEFAGYTEDDLEENSADLEQIIAELTEFKNQDYK